MREAGAVRYPTRDVLEPGARQDRDAVPRGLAVRRHLVAAGLELVVEEAGERVVGELGLLQADHVGPPLVEPGQKPRQTLLDRVHVPCRDAHALEPSAGDGAGSARDHDDLTRRDLLERGAAGAAFLGAGGPVFVVARRRRRPLRGGTFPLGVASGVPLLDGATLWTRVDGLERTGRVELEVAADPQFRRVLHRERPLVHRVRDYTVKRTVRSRRLRPGRTYWYRFESRDGSSQVGRFRTALPADSAEPVRIGFFSCQKWHQGYFTGHRGLAAEPDLDLVVSLGDYIYEEPMNDIKVPERRDTVGANKDGDVQTLREYRDKYRLYKSDPDLIAMHLAHPVCAIWDDHEAEDDYAGASEGDALRPRRVPFAERRRAGTSPSSSTSRCRGCAATRSALRLGARGRRRASAARHAPVPRSRSPAGR